MGVGKGLEVGVFGVGVGVGVGVFTGLTIFGYFLTIQK